MSVAVLQLVTLVQQGTHCNIHYIYSMVLRFLWLGSKSLLQRLTVGQLELFCGEVLQGLQEPKIYRPKMYKKPHRLRRSCSISTLCAVLLKQNSQFSNLCWQIVTKFYNFTLNLWGNNFQYNPKFEWSYFFGFSVCLEICFSDWVLEQPLQIHPWHVTKALQTLSKAWLLLCTQPYASQKHSRLFLYPRQNRVLVKGVLVPVLVSNPSLLVQGQQSLNCFPLHKQALKRFVLMTFSQ